MDATVVLCGSMYTQVYIYIYIYIYFFFHAHIYIYIYTYMSLLVFMHVCRYACNFMYVCMQ